MALTRLMRLGMAAGIAAVPIGCSDTFAPPPGLNFAAATPSCGTSGGGGLAIYLASEPIQSLEPSVPYVRIYLDRSRNYPQSVSGGPLAGPDAVGAAWYHTSASAFEVATLGGIQIEEVNGDRSIEGKLDLVFPDAGRVRGDFRAEWIPQNLICL